MAKRKRKRAVGRPPKLRTPDQRKLFLDAVRDGCSLADACAVAGIASFQTLRNECLSDPAFEAEVKQAEAQCKRKHIKAAKPEFMLERKWWREFARRSPDALSVPVVLGVVTRLFTRWLGKLPPEHHKALTDDLELALDELRLAAGGNGDV